MEIALFAVDAVEAVETVHGRHLCFEIDDVKSLLHSHAVQPRPLIERHADEILAPVKYQ